MTDDQHSRKRGHCGDLSELEFFARVQQVRRDREQRKGPEIPAEAPPAPSAEPPSELERVTRFGLKVESERAALVERIVLWTCRGLVGSYCGVVAIVWLLLRFGADRWWLGTAVMIGPRWLLVPVGCVIVPLVAVLRPRLLAPLPLAALVVAFGIMDVCIPRPWAGADPSDLSRSVCVITCDVQRGRCDWTRLQKLIDELAPDLVALQNSTPDQLTRLPPGWQHVSIGNQAIASPFPVHDTQVWTRDPSPGNPSSVVAVYAVVDTLAGPVGVCNVNLRPDQQIGLVQLAAIEGQDDADEANARQRLREDSQRRRRDSEQILQWLRQIPQVDVVLGDFDMPVESSVYCRCWKSYTNAFSRVGWGLGRTRWATFGRIRYGIRSDHIFTSDGWAPAECKIGPDIGSDRVPLVARIVSQ